jgi:hypothetical protein
VEVQAGDEKWPARAISEGSGYSPEPVGLASLSSQLLAIGYRLRAES